eukprot:7342268-Pyramimonas_sp.AAC.1
MSTRFMTICSVRSPAYTSRLRGSRAVSSMNASRGSRNSRCKKNIASVQPGNTPCSTVASYEKKGPRPRQPTRCMVHEQSLSLIHISEPTRPEPI